VLVFPELAFSPAMLVHTQAVLAEDHGVDGFPLLTVIGLNHGETTRAPGEYVNEAVILGPTGQEIHRHRKLARYALATEDHHVSEQIVTGHEELKILETPIGNIATPICADLFYESSSPVLRASHTSLLLVPSLSPKTSAHLEKARELWANRLACTFVCNRTLWGRDVSKAPSFQLGPGSRAVFDDESEPYQLCQLNSVEEI
jgi:predicted amidohydrolase